METLRSKRSVFFAVVLLGTCLLYFSGFFASNESISYNLPKTESQVVLQDLLRLKANERKVIKVKEKIGHVEGIRSPTPNLKPTFGAALQNIDLSNYVPEDTAILKGRLDTMVERAKVVGEVCQSNTSLSNTVSRTTLVWDKKHTPGVVWCPLYKVASTTWMRNFLRLAHFNENNPKISKNIPKEKQELRRFKVKYGATHNRVFELYPVPESDDERERVLKESVRVLIVRHPFARLLSAYRDKITKKNPIPVRFKFRELQKYIVSRYRSANSSDQSTFPSFAEFIQHVIDSTEKLKTPRDWMEKVKCWVPYWVHCSVCSSDYNIIMKLETMKDDEQFLITLSHLEELKGADHWTHLKGSSSADLVKEYFKDVTREQVKQLYRRFQPDFELFQYDIEDYLAIAKDT